MNLLNKFRCKGDLFEDLGLPLQLNVDSKIWRNVEMFSTVWFCDTVFDN